VLKVADALPDTIVVLDEAYLEFSDTPSLASEAVRRPNLAVLKTLSKAYGIAGARSARCIAIGTRGGRRALPPYPLPAFRSRRAGGLPPRAAACTGADRADQGDRDGCAALRALPIVKQSAAAAATSCS
jgi:histidinol-phosphate/aromatic aminotransferase/cobyric acid decarboxylase-like protein